MKRIYLIIAIALALALAITLAWSQVAMADEGPIRTIWHGITSKSKADEYAEYLNKTGVRDYQAKEGIRAVHILRRIEGEQAHFLIVTFWDSLKAIKDFAGEDVERARYCPEDQDYLLEFEDKVVHYEVIVNT